MIKMRQSTKSKMNSDNISHLYPVIFKNMYFHLLKNGVHHLQ